MNKTFKARLSYDWIYYVSVVILSIVIWMAAFSLYHMPKNYEKLTIFFAGNVIDYSFEDDAKAHLEDKGVLQVEIASCATDSFAFENKYNVVGLNNSDLVLVPISISNKTACSLTFVEINDNYDCSYFTQENKNYGIVVKKDLLSKYFTFNDEDYVVMINGGSVNAGDITTNAYDLVKWMVGYEN